MKSLNLIIQMINILIKVKITYIMKKNKREALKIFKKIMIII